MRPVITTLLVLACLLAATAAAAQSVTVTPNQYDFGTMKQQEIRTTQVVISNDGGGLLIIEDVDADCGCTVPKLLTNELRPGESTTLDIEFNSKKMSGNVFKTIRVSTNDPSNPILDVIITANITTPLIVDPVSQRVGFQRGPRGVEHTKRVTFTATETDKLEIQADATRKGLFEVVVVNGLDGDPRKAALDVILPVDMPIGKQRDNVRVRTNIEDMPTVDIEVRCWVHDILVISPGAINFRFKASFKHSVRVAPAQGEVPFKITGAEVDLPEISAEIKETVPNRETLIILQGTPITADDPRAVETNGRIKGILTIHTDLEQQPTIEVPISYMVRM